MVHLQVFLRRIWSQSSKWNPMKSAQNPEEYLSFEDLWLAHPYTSWCASLGWSRRPQRFAIIIRLNSGYKSHSRFIMFYLTSLNSLINNNRLRFAFLPRKKRFFLRLLLAAIRCVEFCKSSKSRLLEKRILSDLRMVLTSKKSAKQQVLLLLLSHVHLVSGVISPNWSKVRQASQMKNPGNKCVEKTELANINDWESKLKPQIQFVHGVSVTKHRNPLTMLVGHLFGCHAAFEKDRFLKNEPHAVAGFLSLNTLRRDHQSETSVWNSKWVVEGSPFTPPYQHWPVQLCSVCVMWCDCQTP